ncbi:hypothetical protein FA13DRAFT_1317811 [Coprinellus micaceus]|uniref:Uncharacterized protein n=1 Tax=Coprinellus micaceus TaxID=71717 RepID=A0A4Y7SRC0_COPMI|nr:hypothetical protein FA13DRAFT_1317811 [Coprinellus micaceus]
MAHHAPASCIPSVPMQLALRPTQQPSLPQDLSCLDLYTPMLSATLRDWAFYRDPLEVGCQWVHLLVPSKGGSPYQVQPTHTEVQVPLHSSRLQRTCSGATNSPVQMLFTFVLTPSTAKQRAIGRTQSIAASPLIRIDTVSALWSSKPIARVLRYILAPETLLSTSSIRSSPTSPEYRDRCKMQSRVQCVSSYHWRRDVEHEVRILVASAGVLEFPPRS